MIVRAALMRGRVTLESAGIRGAARDMRYLAAYVMGIAAQDLPLRSKEALSPTQITALERAVDARALGQPIAQIIGKRQFWGRDFKVTRDVLDPRPETEGLVAAALTLPFHDVLDLGTGSGAILLSLLADCPSARGLGVDISLRALDVARENAKVLQITLKRSVFLYSNWFENVTGDFDLIVANPPYITQEEMLSLDLGVLTYEPHLALSPGGDGLDPYRIIARDHGPFLRPLGRIIVEIGPCQAANVCALFKSQGLNGLKVHQDFDGRDRLVEAYKHA